MASTRYVTENPYRLLSVCSAADQTELRRKANAAAMTTRAHQFWEVGLAKVFSEGDQDIDSLPSIIGSLTSDPKKRTIYRLFWPFEYSQAPGADGTLNDLDRLVTTCSKTKTFHATQLRFLRAWLDFETRAESPRQAFGFFSALCSDTECDEYLVQLLQNEGESRVNAIARLSDAREEVIDHLLRSACCRAVYLWQANDTPASVSLLRAVAESGFGDDRIDRSLAQVTDVGDREMARIRELIQEGSGWSPEQGAYDTKEVDRLRQLAKAMEGHAPSAALWLEAVDARIGQVACSMRDYAIKLAGEKSDYDGAARVLDEIQALPLPPVARQRVEDDRRQLDAVRGNQRHWAGVRPMGELPVLGTINGVGFKLYGRTPFPGRPGWYFAVHYFVVLFFPVLPLARYLVSDAPSRGWYFHGRAPLSKGSRYHLYGALAVILLLVLCSCLSSRSSKSDPTPASADASRQGPLSTTGSGAMDHQPQDLSGERDAIEQARQKLAVESNALDWDRRNLEATSAQIDSTRIGLDQSSEEAVSEFNEEVARYNHDKDEFNSKVNQYNSDKDEFNRTVQAYNDRLERQ